MDAPSAPLETFEAECESIRDESEPRGHLTNTQATLEAAFIISRTMQACTRALLAALNK